MLGLSSAELDALTDDTPFGSLGGDSMLAVAMAATAARHGLSLSTAKDEPIEGVTIGSLVRSGRAWRGER